MLAIGALAAATGHASARASALEPRSLARGQTIRAQMERAIPAGPGRKLVVTEASSMGVVDSLTLITDPLMPRIVSADDGIYFAICSARARCPYPARSAAWPARTLLPRRLALELALRTFLETSVSLVVVALPTAEPVWVVFERDDLLASVDAPEMRDRLGPLELADTELIDLVDQITRGRLFRPLPPSSRPRTTRSTRYGSSSPDTDETSRRARRHEPTWAKRPHRASANDEEGS